MIENNENLLELSGIGKELAEAQDVIIKYNMQQKDEYINLIKSEIGDLTDKITDLKQKVAQKAKKEVSEQIEALENEKKELVSDLNKLETSTDRAWEDAKKGIDMALEEFEKASQ